MENTTENWNTRTDRTTHIIYQLPIRALDSPQVHIISICFHDWGARISRFLKIVSRAKIMLLIRKANPAVKMRGNQYMSISFHSRREYIREIAVIGWQDPPRECFSHQKGRISPASRGQVVPIIPVGLNIEQILALNLGEDPLHKAWVYRETLK
jgi:hypothetical protein